MGTRPPNPVELAERLIKLFSFAGDTVLDPFMGTGSTAIAAVSTGRNSIGVEIESAYLRIAQQRIQKAAEVKRMAGAVRAQVRLD
jgi:site-specific DNA-methyltransferase (adenine-specific)